jgi:hypothetical protein
MSDTNLITQNIENSETKLTDKNILKRSIENASDIKAFFLVKY